MRTIHRDIVSAFIFSSDNKLLLGKNVKGGVYQDCHVIPGGGIDQGETEVEALARETMEEVRIDISDARIEKVNQHDGASEKTLRDIGERVLVEMTFNDYKVTLPRPAHEVRPVCEDDFEQAEWFSSEQLPDLVFSEPTTRTLQLLGLLPRS